MVDILASVLLCFATIQYMIEGGKKIDLYSIAITIIVPLTILGFLSYQNIKAYNRLEKILNS